MTARIPEHAAMKLAEVEALLAAPQHMKCQDCRTESSTVRERMCPFNEDVHNRVVMVVICDDCHHERCMDI